MFGGALSSRGRDGGTVTLTADTQQFNSKIDQAEANWKKSVGSMSREALKLDLAQDRLRTSLAKYGSESAQAKRATIALRDAEEQATRSAKQMGQAHERSRRSLGGLKAAAIGSAGAFVGAAGLAAGIRSTLGAARDSEMVLGQTKLALENAGFSWEQYGDTIDSAIKKQSQLGFDDEALLRTFSKFLRSTDDVGEALDRNALAANVARAFYLDLEQAANLVTKASLGQSGALRRVGLDVAKNATKEELLAFLYAKTAGAAERASTSGIAAQDRFNVALENAEEIIGGGLAPTVTDYSNRLSAWLEKSGNQEELQRRVNDAVKDGAAVVRGLAGGLRAVQRVAGPIVESLGGIERVTRLLVGLFVAKKVLAFAGAIRTLGASARAAAVGMNLLAAAEARAAAAGGAAAGAGGAGGAGGAARPGFFTSGAFLAGGVAVGGAGVEQRNPKKLVFKNGKYYLDYGNNTLIEITAAQYANSQAEGNEAVPSVVRPNDAARNRRRGSVAPGSATSFTGSKVGNGGRRDGGPKGDGLSAFQRLTLAEIEPGNDLADSKALLNFYASVVENGKLTGDKLFQAKSDYLNQLQRVQSIQDQIGADAAAAAEKRASTAEKQAAAAATQVKKAATARKRANDEAVRAQTEISRERIRSRKNLVYDPISGMFESTKAARDKTSGKAGDAGLSAAEMHRMQFEFLSSLKGVMSEFGSNITPEPGMGQVATNSHVQTSLLRKQNEQLAKLAGGMWHPGTGYSRGELSAAGIGTGF